MTQINPLLAATLRGAIGQASKPTTAAQQIQAERSMFKRLTLPFGGFYESVYDADIDYLEDDLGKAAMSYIDDNLDYTKYHQYIAEAYAINLVADLNKQLGTISQLNPFTRERRDVSMPDAHEVGVHPMDGRNQGDDISALFDISKMPTLADISLAFSDIIDIKDAMQTIAKDRLTSRDGFMSFYSPDIARLYGVPLTEWEEPYIEILIQAMVWAVAYDNIHDVSETTDWKTAIYSYELWGFHQTEFQSSGGSEDAMWSVLTQAQADELNKLIDKE